MGVFDKVEEAGVFDTKAQMVEPVQPLAHTIEIHGQGETDYVIIARTKETDEDESWVMSAILNTIASQRKRMSQAEQLQLADSLWLQRLIVSWTLPISLEADRAKAIGALSQSDRDYLYKTIMAAQPKKKEKLGLGVRGPSSALQQALQKRAKRFDLLSK